MTKQVTKAMALVAERVKLDYEDLKCRWETQAEDVTTILGLTVPPERRVEVFANAAKVLRGAYRFTVKSWGEKVWEAYELQHIVMLIEFEVSYTLAHRPAPKVKDVKPAAPKPAAPAAPAVAAK